MDNHTDKVQSFTRRSLVIGGIQGALMITLAARFGWLQLVDGAKFKTLADNNRISVKLIAPVRGNVMARGGELLAYNEQNFRVQIIPEQTDDLQGSLETLSQILPLRPREIDAVMTRAKQQARFLPIEIIDNLSWEQVAAIEVNMPDLPGISIDVGQRRFYPDGPASAHVVGYVGSVSKADQTGDPVLNLPGFRIGKTGLERTFENDLRGTSGLSRVEVNVRGRTVRELERQPGEEGADLTLTLDVGLQKQVQEVLSRERSASAVVMDVHTGAVYALVSSPTFDANLFTTGISQTMWDKLMYDDARPLTNKAVNGQYPPGSTFKMMTALAGLESGDITPSTRVYCPGHYELGNHRFHCWKRGGHGSVDLKEALAQSCDTYFYQVSREIGIDKIAAIARRFGLGELSGIEMREERKGVVPDTKWKQKELKSRWQVGETLVASIGQGYLLATPLQLAMMTSRLVNGGRAVKPWLVARKNGQASANAVRTWPSLGIKPGYLAYVKEGMDAVTMGETGTARNYNIKEEGREMGGKTGTSQVRRITMSERAEGLKSQGEMPWKHRHHALFVGYAPAHKPRYAVAVVVEHGGSGSGVAAPLARDILKATQDIDPANKPVSTVAKKPEVAS